MPGEKKKVKRTCGYQSPFVDEPCGRPLYDDERCLFHSKDIEGKKDEFDEQFWKEFERQKKDEEQYDFYGFVFPGDISFKKIEFEKVADFRAVQFSGNAYFERAQFSRDTSFFVAKFSGEADFGETQFSGMADFMGAQFKGDTYFEKAKFSGEAGFEAAQFSGVASFEESQFSRKAHFTETQFSGVAYFGKTQFFEKVDFNRAKFKEEANFGYTKFKKCNSCEMFDTYFYNVYGLFEFIEKNRKKFEYSNKTEFLPDNFTLILSEEATARYPIISRKIRDDMYLLSFKKKHPKLHFIWWLFADCGRSVLRWALWSLIFAEMFAIIFGLFHYFNPISFKSEVISFSWPGISLLYYSIVTFTTLGFGDIVPKIPGLQIIIMTEVILGYIMLGGLISILANKLARRS